MAAKYEVTQYMRGTNARLDAIMDKDDLVWIIQGPNGRLPILAGSEAEATAKYKER